MAISWRFPGQLFDLGQVVSTPGALESMMRAEVSSRDYLIRHASGDWGDLDPFDMGENAAAIGQERRILSAYNLPGNGGRLWIITEADRSATTFLLPEEY